MPPRDPFSLIQSIPVFVIWLLKVEDVQACLAEFDQLGIPHTELRVDDFDGRKMAFFFDPDGLPLELHE